MKEQVLGVHQELIFVVWKRTKAKKLTLKIKHQTRKTS